MVVKVVAIAELIGVFMIIQEIIIECRAFIQIFLVYFGGLWGRIQYSL